MSRSSSRFSLLHVSPHQITDERRSWRRGHLHTTHTQISYAYLDLQNGWIWTFRFLCNQTGWWCQEGRQWGTLCIITSSCQIVLNELWGYDTIILHLPIMSKQAVCCYCIITQVNSKPRSCGLMSQQQDCVSVSALFGSRSLTGDQVSRPLSSPTQFYVMTNQYRAPNCQSVSQRPLILCIISLNQGQTHVSFSVVAVLLCHCVSGSLILAKCNLFNKTTVVFIATCCLAICMSPSNTLHLSGEWILMIVQLVEHEYIWARSKLVLIYNIWWY